MRTRACTSSSKHLRLAIGLTIALHSAPARAEVLDVGFDYADTPHNVQRLTERAAEYERKINEIEADFSLYREHFRKTIRGSLIGYLNAMYVKFGFALIGARASTFTNPPGQYGLGLFAGVGRYFGRNHILELDFANDIYLAMTLRYRLEFHVIEPNFSLGPVLGFRFRVSDPIIKNPFLNEKPRPTFLVMGWFFGIPLGKTVITVEVDYVANRQTLLYVNAGAQLFF